MSTGFQSASRRPTSSCSPSSALVKLGVPALTAHFFVFYYGCISTITPPVALAAYVAGGIAGADVNKVGWTAAAYALTSFVLPFAFVLAPALTLLGTALENGVAVVTGHDEDGKSVVVSDEVAVQHLERSNRPGVRLTNFWIERGSPAEYDGPVETCTGDFVLRPPPLGSTFRCVEFLPEDPEVLANHDGKSAFAEMGASDNIVDDARHPFFHRTDSLNYVIVLTDEIWMVLDDESEETLMRAGDVLIQRGNNHAWSNRSEEPCVIAFVLIDKVCALNRWGIERGDSMVSSLPVCHYGCVHSE